MKLFSSAMIRFLLLLFFTTAYPLNTEWGFFGHKKINRLAVFTLPPEMLGFYKANISFITEEAVTPDKRRYIIKEEAAKHYIDLDEYTELPPRNWEKAVELYSEDSLKEYGILPWNILLLKYKLTEAFKEKNHKAILRLSADLGHYLADANVPLHTTRNYNGQLTGQHGIHGFWESRLPELFFESYELLTGRAEYIENPTERIWQTILESNSAVDSVLLFEKDLNEKFEADKKYAFEERGTATVKTYSKDYSKAYHKLLSGQVERQMRKAIKLTGDMWYTCWVDAGQPSLNAKKEEYILDHKDKEEIGHKDCNH